MSPELSAHRMDDFGEIADFVFAIHDGDRRCDAGGRRTHGFRQRHERSGDRASNQVKRQKHQAQRQRAAAEDDQQHRASIL